MIRLGFLLVTATLFADMQFFAGDSEAMIVESGQDVSLMTWNVYGLPNNLVLMRSWEERIDGIAETIIQANADVVVLQECFEIGLNLGLYERLKSEYAYIYLDIGDNKIPRSSGLALFSKCPIGDFRFTQHPDLLDLSRNAKLGIIDFFLLGENAVPLAHVASSQFLGSANFEWRMGVIDDGRRLSYVEVRQEEALTALGIERSIPQYICGDLNVDRRAPEFDVSPLNAKVNSRITDAMSSAMQQIPTNTDFWKIVRGLLEVNPSLTEEKIMQLSRDYHAIFNNLLKEKLTQAPWNQFLAEFEPSFFSTLEASFNPNSNDGKLMWEYFKQSSLNSIQKEQNFWQKNGNKGRFPPVSIGRVLEVSALPIEEALDFVLGANALAQISQIEILSGYDYDSNQRTFSDHHPVKAIIKVGK